MISGIHARQVRALASVPRAVDDVRQHAKSANENRHAIAIEGGLVSFRHTYGFAPLVRFIFEGRASLATKNGDKDLQKR